MINELLQELKKITPEEERILAGECKIEKDIYMSSESDVVDAKKLLEEGKLIEVRTHTRFVHFPKHTHNYVEVIYMCSGSTHHVINGKDIILKQGELLFLNQKVTQEIYPAGEDDIAVNFIILPQFFEYGLKWMEPEGNMLHSFIVDCLRGNNATSNYLHFTVSDILPIQNLIENLIWTIHKKLPNKRSINQATMGLLFLQLMNYMDKLKTENNEGKQQLVLSVLDYIEKHYQDGELSELASKLHYDIYWLSREIKKQTGKTYTELVQAKRLNQAAYLLTTTTLSVMEIAIMVGYDNISYFHRIFKEKYLVSPRKYRVEHGR